MTRYAFIGIGNMGLPMVKNLLGAGHQVQVFDLDAGSVAAASGLGATGSKSLSEVIIGTDVVITMLPAGPHVRSVYQQLFELVDDETLLLDCSTVDIDTSHWCHEESRKRGLRFVDAPVSGGMSGAEQATLAFMIGGQADDVEQARAYVEPMAGQTFAAGGPTTGTAAKIANNLMVHINLLANSEGSQLAARLGLDPKVFHDIVSASSGRSWAQQVWYPVPNVVETSASDGNFDAVFRADLSYKDLGLALDAAEQHSLRMPATELVHTQIADLRAEGYGHKDCTLIAKYVNPDGNLEGFTPQSD